MMTGFAPERKRNHPLKGFAMEQVLGTAQAGQDAYHYRTHAGAELDLLSNIVRRFNE